MILTSMRPSQRTTGIATIFIHIPKTAGMSFKKAIYGDDIINEGHRKITFYKQVFRN